MIKYKIKYNQSIRMREIQMSAHSIRTHLNWL